MEKRKKKIKKEEKGITLVALVVTIIVLLILAGVAISFTLGEDGIFKKAKDAADRMQNAASNEKIQIGELTNEITKVMEKDEIGTDIYVTLYNDGTLTFGTQNEPIEGKTVIKEYGNIKGEEYTSWNEGDEHFNDTPWFNEKETITKVSIIDEIVPTSMANWFESCSNLTEIIGLEKINTEYVENMAGMFGRCNSLISVNVSKFDTSNVEDMVLE